jgi:hypothetical protein
MVLLGQLSLLAQGPQEWGIQREAKAMGSSRPGLVPLSGSLHPKPKVKADVRDK